MGEAVKEKKTSWFKGLKAEFKRIIWPDQKTLIKETTAVVVVSVILGLVISALDFVIRIGIEFLVR
ncbi:MAG: preprotein translocase subunit SecE [Lachnospiraceae bacterium]